MILDKNNEFGLNEIYLYQPHLLKQNHDFHLPLLLSMNPNQIPDHSQIEAIMNAINNPILRYFGFPGYGKN